MATPARRPRRRTRRSPADWLEALVISIRSAALRPAAPQSNRSAVGSGKKAPPEHRVDPPNPDVDTLTQLSLLGADFGNFSGFATREAA